MGKNTSHAQKSTGLFHSVASSVWNRHQHSQIKKELRKRFSKGKSQANIRRKIQNFEELRIERKRRLRLVHNC